MQNTQKELFYCYSPRLCDFLEIFGFYPIKQEININNNKPYKIYKRTDKLGFMLKKWDEIKQEISFEQVKLKTVNE